MTGRARAAALVAVVIALPQAGFALAREAAGDERTPPAPTCSETCAPAGSAGDGAWIPREER